MSGAIERTSTKDMMQDTDRHLDPGAPSGALLRRDLRDSALIKAELQPFVTAGRLRRREHSRGRSAVMNASGTAIAKLGSLSNC